VPCNTYVISGNVETKPIQSFMPAIVPQLSQEMMNEIGGGMQSGAGPEEEEEEEDDDEDIPELVENFEDASKK
jgi:nascent polypeptide-associated complex subunit beta